ncbi:MAG: hypothetical protein PHG63_03655, partial [Candidatus Dojkabacteria bacterium]|nr:hypothetical protein [Candidatus Dojkabacteria bacterium]
MAKPVQTQHPPTQDHLDLEKIVDNLVVLKDGTVSLVLRTTTVNFDLLSEPEQDAKIRAFGQLLNSLTHSCQILIRTKKINIRGYLGYLRSFNNSTISEGLRRQIAIYTRFVQNLITRNEVLDKKFYIIVPFRSLIVTKTDPMKQMFGKEEKITNVDRVIEQAKAYLYRKRDHIMKQLLRIGLLSRSEEHTS